jgi:hypothetical protein
MCKYSHLEDYSFESCLFWGFKLYVSSVRYNILVDEGGIRKQGAEENLRMK